MSHLLRFEHLLDLDIVAYFAKDESFNRNVVGCYGWLNRVRLGLIDYEGKLYLSRADDEV